MEPKDVPGRISEASGEVLQGLAERVPDGQVIVEIGAYLGKSTCYLARGSAEGASVPVVSIDAWDTPGNLHGPNKYPGMYTRPSNYTHYLNHLISCGVSHLVKPVKSMSSSAPVPDDPIGLLWIDAAHNFEGVRGDFNRFAPQVPLGGWVVFDDYTKSCSGVVRFVDRLVEESGNRWDWYFSHKPIVVGQRLQYP